MRLLAPYEIAAFFTLIFTTTPLHRAFISWGGWFAGFYLRYIGFGGTIMICIVQGIMNSKSMYICHGNRGTLLHLIY